MRCPANSFRLLFASCLLLALAGSTSCSTYQNLVVYQSDAALIALGELPAGYPSLGPNHHPYTISPEKVLTLLESLEYREGSLLPFSWGQPRRVFTAKQGKILAQELSKAFGMALPQEVVAFTVADEEKPDRRTKGLTFIVGEELHLILEELRKPSYFGEQKTYQLQAHQWELAPGNRQRLYATSPEGKGTVPHWVICPLKP
ncbi:MAG: hypothetical protein E8D46_00605 [Nitrospira sp.]|nr:hypothetical protein [Nitrospira sp.]TKB75887.1 MAG: hypothetical protein E8D46_00605 [Nitrospira sp.]